MYRDTMDGTSLYTRGRVARVVLRTTGSSRCARIVAPRRGPALTQTAALRGSPLIRTSMKTATRGAARGPVRVHALFEQFTERSIKAIIFAQGFARDMGSMEVRYVWYLCPGFASNGHARVALGGDHGCCEMFREVDGFCPRLGRVLFRSARGPSCRIEHYCSCVFGLRTVGPVLPVSGPSCTMSLTATLTHSGS